MKLYVGNLAFALSENDLKNAFEEFGQVESVQIIIDRDTGRSKGFGFIEMSNNEEAKAAISAMDGKDLEGRPLRVNEARPKEDRGGGGGGGRGGRGGGGGGGRGRY